MEIDKKFIKQLHKPNLLIYWGDITTCAVVGWGSFFYSLYAQNISLKITSFFLAAFLIYRGQIFIHEVVHQRDAIKGFARFYEIFFGWPNAYPSYIYDPHLYHHIPKEYSTSDDPEYLIGTNNSLFKMFGPILSAIFLPFLLTLRFGILPIFNLFFKKNWQKKIFRHASTLVMNIHYQRPLKNKKEMSDMLFNDFMCFLYRLLVIIAIYFHFLPIEIILYWFFLVAFVSMMNMFRAKVAHFYLGTGESFSKMGQLLDSVTISGSLFTELWAPLSLRFHAGHHLYPQMPYHSLLQLHKYLTSDPMKDHPYNQTIFKSFSEAAKFFISMDIEKERKRVYSS